MQNFPTRTVHLNQGQYEQARSFPAYEPPRPGVFSPEGYRVVDVVLRDGSTHEGLLLVADDKLLVPEALPEFNDADIEALRPTPPDRHPDFTITDPDSVRRRFGIEHGNAIRLGMFGPDEPETDWRSVPIEEAHEEALEADAKIWTFGGEIPACFHGPHLVALVPGGMRLRVYTASTEEAVELVIRPKSAAVWRHILDHHIEIDPAFTLGEMVQLLDLPEEVDREIFMRTMPGWREPMSFRPWVTSVLAEGFEPDTGMDWIEITALAGLDGETSRYSFHFDATGMGVPLDVDDEDTGFRKGQRINWSLWGYGRVAALRDVPLRYNDELALPVTHEETMAHLRGPRRDWQHGGREGPEPEAPVAFRTKRSITLGEFIGALFDELSPGNWHREEDE